MCCKLSLLLSGHARFRLPGALATNVPWPGRDPRLQIMTVHLFCQTFRDFESHLFDEISTWTGRPGLSKRVPWQIFVYPASGA